MWFSVHLPLPALTSISAKAWLSLRFQISFCNFSYFFLTVLNRDATAWLFQKHLQEILVSCCCQKRCCSKRQRLSGCPHFPLQHPQLPSQNSFGFGPCWNCNNWPKPRPVWSLVCPEPQAAKLCGTGGLFKVNPIWAALPNHSPDCWETNRSCTQQEQEQNCSIRGETPAFSPLVSSQR